MGKKIKRICVLLMILFCILGLMFSRSLSKDLKISLKEKRIEGLGISGLSFVFYVNISNSSSKHYYLSGYSYRFVVEEMEYLRLATHLENHIKIKANEETLLSFPLKITYANLFQAVEVVKKKDKVLCYLAGEMKFSDGRREKGHLPFAFSGEFPILRKPEIELLLIQIRDLTIGGADLNYKVDFKNNNFFELLIDKMTYKLHLEERLISEGTVEGDKNIGSKGEKEFSIPVLLNFFEVGKEVYSILHQTYARCQFSGEIEVKTIWGRLRIPFEKRGEITIARDS